MADVNPGYGTFPFGNIANGPSDLSGVGMYPFVLEQTLTLDTTGATTDSTIKIPANAFVLGVLAQVTTAISGAGGITGASVGDASTAARWGTLAALTAGSTNFATCWTPLKGSISTDATGPTVGASALAIRITGTGGDGTPAAGVVRVSAFGFAPLAFRP